MSITKAERFINQLENALKHQFDVYGNDKLESLPLRFSAHYYRRDDRYMFTKNVTVWSVENNQHIFLYEAKTASIEEFEQFKQELDQYIRQHKSKRTSHMSSIYIGIFLTANSPDPIVERKAKKRLEKFHLFNGENQVGTNAIWRFFHYLIRESR